MEKPKIYIALPAMDESEHLPALIQVLQNQTWEYFCLVVCINQPENFWNLPEKHHICEGNQNMLNYLYSLADTRIVILDRSSAGLGWTPKAYGIGVARRYLMDYISAKADNNDIIVSMDADTYYADNFLASVAENLQLNSSAYAISIPYYHRLTGNDPLDRAMLRYEIYMRNYAVNMWHIGSPYAFTALGSSIVLPVWAYNAVGGMTPKQSGEDFYFLQKVVKTGRLLHWNAEMAYPATRLSDRVFFGTGPALAKGMQGDWNSYPIYSPALFDQIHATYQKFRPLFKKQIETPLDEFLLEKFGHLPWEQLRKNFKTEEHFIRACHEKIDGLRILQYLKDSQEPDELINQKSLHETLAIYATSFVHCADIQHLQISFELSSVELLDHVRDALFEVEMKYRLLHWNDFSGLTAFYN